MHCGGDATHKDKCHVAAGKHIFTEKPVAVDGPGIRKVMALVDESKKKKLCIAAGTQRRHNAGYIATMKQVHEGAIGDIAAVHGIRPNSITTKWGLYRPIRFLARIALAEAGSLSATIQFYGLYASISARCSGV
jgi:predicted dehydrogenase